MTIALETRGLEKSFGGLKVTRDLSLQMTGRTAEGIGGWTRLYGARVKEIVLGPTKTRRTSFLLVIGEANITPAFDAIVGAPFLLQADLDANVAASHTPLVLCECFARDGLQHETGQIPAEA